MSEQGADPPHRVVDPDAVDARARYQLLTSLVVPRPIAWVSTRDREGRPNLAPFSYFAALSASPMLVGVSIGRRRRGPKDSLVNIRATGVFCVNVVSERHLEAMNLTSGDHPPEVDEFEVAGLPLAEAEVGAPCVADAPAILECRAVREVDLDAPNTLVIGRVVRVRIARELPLEDAGWAVSPEALRPVGRLQGGAYALPGLVRRIPRPRVEGGSVAGGDASSADS